MADKPFTPLDHRYPCLVYTDEKVAEVPAGPPGPAGADGAPGPAGADGATGPQGPPGPVTVAQAVAFAIALG